MSNTLPQNKLLVKVTYEYENGEIYETDSKESAKNLQDNLESVNGIIASRSYIEMNSVTWKKNESKNQTKVD